MNSERVNKRIDLLKFDLLTALGIYAYRVNKAVNSNKELFVSFSVCSASHPLPPGHATLSLTCGPEGRCVQPE